jgi:hypothetical protein
MRITNTQNIDTSTDSANELLKVSVWLYVDIERVEY